MSNNTPQDGSPEACRAVVGANVPTDASGLVTFMTPSMDFPRPTFLGFAGLVFYAVVIMPPWFIWWAIVHLFSGRCGSSCVPGVEDVIWVHITASYWFGPWSVALYLTGYWLYLAAISLFL